MIFTSWTKAPQGSPADSNNRGFVNVYKTSRTHSQSMVYNQKTSSKKGNSEIHSSNLMRRKDNIIRESRMLLEQTGREIEFSIVSLIVGALWLGFCGARLQCQCQIRLPNSYTRQRWYLTATTFSQFDSYFTAFCQRFQLLQTNMEYQSMNGNNLIPQEIISSRNRLKLMSKYDYIQNCIQTVFNKPMSITAGKKHIQLQSQSARIQLMRSPTNQILEIMILHFLLLITCPASTKLWQSVLHYENPMMHSRIYHSHHNILKWFLLPSLSIQEV